MRIFHEEMTGWGGINHMDVQAAMPASEQQLTHWFKREDRPIIARGLGRSYGDSALSDEAVVLLPDTLNCVLSFDPESGIMEAEAGASLEKVIEAVLPHGWFLHTTPGTRYVSLGGAIAADVHGKNHHVDGSFVEGVLSMSIMIADGSILHCSREENTDLFWATIGGMGLTGFILTACLQLQKVSSAYYKVDYRKTGGLEETLELLQSTEGAYRYSVGWIDCLVGGGSRGRSVLMLGNQARVDELPLAHQKKPFVVPQKRARSVPIDFPSGVLNPLSVRAFNELFYLRHRNRTEIVDYQTYFYPLDAIGHWNRIYGRRGFIQYQALFPFETASNGLKTMLETIQSYGLASFLAVIKRSGPANEAPLSFLHEGYTLALDIPYAGKRLHEMTAKLDQVLLQHDGRLYLAKDALMSAETFAAMYPQKGAFLAIKAKYDSQNRFTSNQAKRLGLTV